MKKTYATPTLVESGEVVEETRIGTTPDRELTPVAKDSMPGSVGYFL
jgi:hypothetical protein